MEIACVYLFYIGYEYVNYFLMCSSSEVEYKENFKKIQEPFVLLSSYITFIIIGMTIFIILKLSSKPNYNVKNHTASFHILYILFHSAALQEFYVSNQKKTFCKYTGMITIKVTISKRSKIRNSGQNYMEFFINASDRRILKK